MLSLYGQYINERESFEIIENNCGFASYKIINNECYLRDIFVSKDYRKMHVARKLADEISFIAKEKGCIRMYGTVVPSAPGSTLSIKLLLEYGLSLHQSSNDFIVLAKDL